MVYIDLLVIQNLFMNYVVLIGTSIVLNRITKLKKVFLSSVVGTISLIFLFFDIGKLLVFIITILFSFLMSLISFSYHSLIYTVKNIIYMYFMSMFLAGAIYLVNVNILPQIDNYLLNVIILMTITIIITIFYIKSMKNIKNNNSNYYVVDIYFKDKPKITMEAFLDTGNKLIDPYTTKPIILISKKKININNQKKVLVPYNTIDNNGLLECIYAEKIYIHKVGYRNKIPIGLVDNINMDCILNQKLLN